MQSLADRIANMRSPLGSSATKTKLAVDPSLDMDLTHTADGSIKISPAHSMRDINNRETSRSGTPVLAEEEKGDREGGDDLTLQATPTQESIKAPALPTVLSHGAVQADLVYDRQALAAMPPHALDNIVDGLSERMAGMGSVSVLCFAPVACGLPAMCIARIDLVHVCVRRTQSEDRMDWPDARVCATNAQQRIKNIPC